ncbi:DUF3558 family protein [Nocardia sp. NPDC058519]|uniref:DUF3558 family protein n=1 Tax=Nocardia sp. NPDC058519 TaxID=3346535 RepID=UPI003668680C
MSMRTPVSRTTAALLLALAVAGCSAAEPSGPPQRAEDSTLAGCGPLTLERIEEATGLTGLRPVGAPTICTWTTTTDDSGTADVTYGWLAKNSLMFDRETAVALGYRTDALVTESFGGFYWRHPQSPGSCGVSAADSGTVTWWVHHRGPGPHPDPCPTAWQLIFETVKLDG